MTLAGFEPGTSCMEVQCPNHYTMNSLVNQIKKSWNLHLSGVTGTFLDRGPPIVRLDRARLGLSRTVFRVFGMSKLTRLDSRHM